MTRNKIQQGLLLIVFSFLFCPAGAQSWVKKAAKAVFTMKTFDANGQLLGSSNGIFVSEQGEALTSFEPLRGASSAVVIDAAGKEWPVGLILGASGTYDVAKIRVEGKKFAALNLSATKAADGEQVWLLPFMEQKLATEGKVARSETFGDGYDYYTVRMKMPQNGVGLPLLNDAGELLALMQQPATEQDTLCYAVSARFADSLKTTGLSINDPVLRSTNIRKALPSDLAQAQLTLFVAASTLDSAQYVQLLEDFIGQFPAEPDGYVSRAQFAANDNRYADADADMKQAQKVADKSNARSAEVHYSYSRLVYQKLTYRPEPAYDPWTLDMALKEAEAAYAADPQPGYLQQQAYVCYAQKRYAEASAIYDRLFSTALRSPDLFYEASRCQLMQADTLRHLALLDSAVAQFTRPYLKEAAPYILARAQARIDAGKWRDGVNDLNDYETLMAAQVNDNFYYLRFQAEQSGRLFQQALNDIVKAIAMNPSQEIYYAEKASLEVRVGLYDEAVATAEECIKLAPEYSDGHLFLGLARCLKGEKEQGVKSLLKAKELGDPQAEGLIEKYAK